MTNQYANSEGESRIHMLIPLSSTVLKIKGISKFASLKVSGLNLRTRRNVSQAKVSCQGEERWAHCRRGLRPRTVSQTGIVPLEIVRGRRPPGRREIGEGTT